MARTTSKLPKKPENRNLGRFCSIYSHFSVKFWDVQNHQFRVEPPNCTFGVYGRLRKGHSGSHKTQKCQKSPNSIKLSVIRPMDHFWIIWTPNLHVRLSLIQPQTTCTLWSICCNYNSFGPECWKVSVLAKGVLGSQNTKNFKNLKYLQNPSWWVPESILGVIEPVLADMAFQENRFLQTERGGVLLWGFLGKIVLALLKIDP